MILKGNQRGKGHKLAAQLLKAENNQLIDILEVRGAVAQDLHGAFDEWYVQSFGTKCLKYLYSLSINPDPSQTGLSRAQYFDLIERAEKELGLEGQPRAVVFHVHSDGREHGHAVWSRIDTDAMKAVHISHDRLKLRTVAQKFANDHGLRLPPGMRKIQQGARGYIKHRDDRDLRITVTWLMKAPGHCRRTVQRYLRALEAEGYIDVHVLQSGTAWALVLPSVCSPGCFPGITL